MHVQMKRTILVLSLAGLTFLFDVKEGSVDNISEFMCSVSVEKEDEFKETYGFNSLT